LSAYPQEADYKYWIGFTDKAGTPFSIDHPEEFLSLAAVDRRQRQNIMIEENDLPVSPAYIDSLSGMGLHVLYSSRWFNAAVVQTSDSLLCRKLMLKNFVRDARLLFNSLLYARDKKTVMAGEYLHENPGYGNSIKQISLIHGNQLHDQGYRGKGMTIAILDGGFYGVQILSAFDSLWAGGHILGWKDFVNPASDVFKESSHGMSVLSVMGGIIPGELIGTAPEADFWLIRSEDTWHETRLEEANWLAAAEFADSAGADIINSSLGYFRFDDSLQDYSYPDMDGNTTLVTKAADLAARKGILVVSSAGNAGTTTWKYINAPADGDSVLSVGAVDSNAVIASFSSYGPSYDLRVKPNTLALGSRVVIWRANDSTGIGSGTSFAAPVISGMAACLWQKYPLVTSYELLQVIEQCSDRYNYPDPHYGYGLPDFLLAESIISGIYNERFSANNRVLAYPDPFTSFLNVQLSAGSGCHAVIEMYDLSGRLLMNSSQRIPVTGIVTIEGLEQLPEGFYILCVYADGVSTRLKIIKQ